MLLSLEGKRGPATATQVPRHTTSISVTLNCLPCWPNTGICQVSVHDHNSGNAQQGEQDIHLLLYAAAAVISGQGSCVPCNVVWSHCFSSMMTLCQSLLAVAGTAANSVLHSPVHARMRGSALWTQGPTLFGHSSWSQWLVSSSSPCTLRAPAIQKEYALCSAGS